MDSSGNGGEGESFRDRVSGWVSPPVSAALRFRLMIKFLLHVAIFVASYLLAYLVRFDLELPVALERVVLGTIPLMVLSKAAGFSAFGLFHGWWRYVSIKDILPIAAGCSLGSTLFLFAAFLLPGPLLIPRSIFIIDWGITMLLVLSGRFLIRTGRETFGRRREGGRRRVLVVGAGSAGQMIAREIRENPALGMEAACFIDDDPTKIGSRIQGIKVLGTHGKIEEACRQQKIDEVIVAIPSATPSRLRHIVGHCEKVTVRFRILPGVGELIDGKASVRLLRNVVLEDLLGRDPVKLDLELIRRDITGQTVMVTGAAGSIGSELCRQVVRLSPGRLVMFEIAESALFDIEMEMREKFPDVECVPAIGDIRDRARVREVMTMHRPNVVYHAAAYKHVPLMEYHPAEAVKNNVVGTRIVAEVASECEVARFVLVSTDKAVRPTNVMGATKRVAELIVQDMNGKSGRTVFVAVRFGNVLGSIGSVIPVFRKQLETTGKLTVTHPDASRYFMLIPEAAGLILQAGSMGTGGEVFVLDMGEPMKVVDLATNLIRLSGKELGINAEIVFTGLRPGEKLHEELVVEGEDVLRTAHPKVMKMIGDFPVSPEWRRRLDLLAAHALRADRQGVIHTLDSLVKGYRPDLEFHGISGLPLQQEEDLSLSAPPSRSVH